jgi:hypothetical protein
MNLCRLCGDEKSPLDFSVELTDRTSSDWSYRDLIEHHTRVPLKSSKLLPQSVCDECRLKVDGFVEFSSKIQKTQENFNDQDFEETETKECFVQVEEILLSPIEDNQEERPASIQRSKRLKVSNSRRS